MALVPLHDQWKIRHVLVHPAQLFLQLVPALDVLLQLACLRVGDKDNAIRAFEHRDPCLLIKDLARNRVKLEADLEAMHLPQLKREQVKIQRTLGLSVDGDHITDILWIHSLVYVMKIGCFTAETNSIIDDLTVDLSFRHVDQGHILSCPLISARPSLSKLSSSHVCYWFGDSIHDFVLPRNCVLSGYMSAGPNGIEPRYVNYLLSTSVYEMNPLFDQICCQN